MVLRGSRARRRRRALCVLGDLGAVRARADRRPHARGRALSVGRAAADARALPDERRRAEIDRVQGMPFARRVPLLGNDVDRLLAKARRRRLRPRRRLRAARGVLARARKIFAKGNRSRRDRARRCEIRRLRPVQRKGCGAAMMKWAFVLQVLDAIKAGGEVSIDRRMIFRVDIGTADGRSLAAEAAMAAEILRKEQAGALQSYTPDQATTRIVGALGELGAKIEEASKKGRKR